MGRMKKKKLMANELKMIHFTSLTNYPQFVWLVKYYCTSGSPPHSLDSLDLQQPDPNSACLTTPPIERPLALQPRGLQIQPVALMLANESSSSSNNNNWFHYFCLRQIHHWLIPLAILQSKALFPTLVLLVSQNRPTTALVVGSFGRYPLRARACSHLVLLMGSFRYYVIVVVVVVVILYYSKHVSQFLRKIWFLFSVCRK